jgi:hypothetical protein
MVWVKKRPTVKPALKQGLKTGVGPAFINQTRPPQDFFHRPEPVCEKAAFGPRPFVDHAKLTSLAGEASSVMRVIQHR